MLPVVLAGKNQGSLRNPRRKRKRERGGERKVKRKRGRRKRRKEREIEVEKALGIYYFEAYFYSLTSPTFTWEDFSENMSSADNTQQCQFQNFFLSKSGEREHGVVLPLTAVTLTRLLDKWTWHCPLEVRLFWETNSQSETTLVRTHSCI